ncbi:Epidermal patterning factor-like protein [Heracleum sosnowskyi]|uniref:Epidermal patterning factor-like protein n=1 Tax=Heracleum sosnowskyi TaxID=360622 RepID=A0AAD8I8P4_9APIA|nr:Epidermal patterning factor-like protein [Heracleum sosnowskyi]
MGVLHHRTVSITALFFVVFAVSAVATRTSTHRKLGGEMKEEGEDPSVSFQIFEREIMNRRRLSGPGSSPPSCRSKCGRCSPCSPVHIPVHPGFTLPLEYYPEAWRCKCRNKLYMP